MRLLNYNFDGFKDINHYWSLEKYLFLVIGSPGWKGKIPSVQFWGITFLFLKMIEYDHREIKIIFPNGLILTSKEAFKEMEDSYIEYKGGDIYLWLLQKKEFFGW